MAEEDNTTVTKDIPIDSQGNTVAGLEGTVTLLGSDPELDDISLFE